RPRTWLSCSSKRSRNSSAASARRASASIVIASEAKQSGTPLVALDYFVASLLAMTILVVPVHVMPLAPVHSAPIILREIIRDRLCRLRIDRRAIGIDHLADLGAPQRGVGIGRVDDDVIEAVTAGTVGLDLVEPGRLLERDRLLLRRRRQSERGRGQNDGNPAHGVLLSSR